MSIIDKTITDKEIRLAEEVFLPKGAFFDNYRRDVIKNTESTNIIAAPGSGKTTVLLAKLFILSQRMPFQDGRGICVLTHTNVAIDEIKARLGSRADVLFTYPNFFGTFQSFIDKYLAIPYYSLRAKSRSVTIDQKVYEERINRRYNYNLDGFSFETQKNARYFLNSRRGILSNIRLRSSEGKVILTEGISDKVIKIKRPARSLQKKGDFSELEKVEIINWIKKLKFELLNEGVLCYDDAYYLAQQYINKYEDKLKELFSNRFKFIFIDESQDTYHHQNIILDRIFNEQVVKQHFGDPNQSIFDNKNSEQTKTFKTNTITSLKIPQSQRFGSSIAEKLKTICVEENNQIEGSLLIPSLKPHIILFETSEVSNVLEKFVELIKKYNLHSSNVNDRNNIYKAIGWRGNKTEDILKKLCLASYFPNFNKNTNENKSIHYDNLIYFIKKVPNEVIAKEGARFYFDCIMNGILRFLYLANIKNVDEIDKARYFNKTTLINYLKEYKYKEYLQLKTNISEWIMIIQQEKEQYSYNVFKLFKNYLLNDIKSIFPRIKMSKVEGFLEEIIPETHQLDTQDRHFYISHNHPEIKVKIDTVHAVKGETHKATLYLETFKDKHDLRLLLPFLKGQYDEKLVSKKQINAALKVAYVGMSRPSHLLCLAMCCDKLNQTDISELKQSGWEIIYVNQLEVSV